MYSSSLLLLGVVLLSMSPVNCVGTAFIQNWCNIEVYVWSVANVTNNTVNRLPPTVGTYNETYRLNPNGGGISLKIAILPFDTDITQFEYTYNSSNPYVYYDISNVNGYPFEEWGLTLVPSYPNCSSISCAPGVQLCGDVYNKFNDDLATHHCDLSANLTLILCPSQTTTIETITATIMTTEPGGSTFLSTRTTVIDPLEQMTIPPFQTTMATTTETVTTTTTTTDSGSSTF